MSGYEVRVAGQRFDAGSVLVRQADGAHETVTFVSRDEPASSRPGTPVVVRWGDIDGEQAFYGYVNHLEPHFASTGTPKVKYACIGATRTLLGSAEWMWRHQTADAVVRSIAAGAYLSADTELHPVAQDVAWTGSAWALLIELAERTGYVLAANGTEIRFLSPSETIRRSAPTALRFVRPGRLTSFRPLAGQVPGGPERATLIAHGLDPRTGTPFTASAEPLGQLGRRRAQPAYARMAGSGAESPGEAAVELEGAARAGRFQFRATAEVAGDARLVQDSVVYLDGVGGNYNGHWFVTAVEHELTPGRYVAYLTLGRDAWGTFAPTGLEGLRPMWSRRDPLDARQAVSPPTMLSAGVWRSGWGRQP